MIVQQCRQARGYLASSLVRTLPVARCRQQRDIMLLWTRRLSVLGVPVLARPTEAVSPVPGTGMELTTSGARCTDTIT